MINIDAIMEELHPGWMERKSTKYMLPLKSESTTRTEETADGAEESATNEKPNKKENKMKRHRFVENEDANSEEAASPDGKETIEQACGKLATACEKVIKRRRRTKAEIQAAPAQQNMYTMSVVGAATLADYPLQPGEKLVIAKLTPIHVVKGAI